MTVIKNIAQLATCPNNTDQSDIGLITNAAVAFSNGIITYVGKEADLPQEYKTHETIDAQNKLVVPGLIDCHTHLCFAGSRENEFTQRIQGKTYLEIAQQGGGIASTVASTRNASQQELVDRAQTHLNQIIKLGITTIEAKSGYGLTLKDEIKILQAYKKLNQNNPIDIISTFLGAHTFPPEYKQNQQAYIDLIINEMLPAVAKENLAEFCDIFIEKGAFTLDQAKQILTAAQQNNLKIKAHADQLHDAGGANLAAEFNATSADHLEYISDKSLTAMAKSNTIAVILPIASLYTFEPPLDARKVINKNVPVAIATDFNPGSAPSYHLPLAMMLACTLNRLTPNQVLKSVTINAAKAINKQGSLGSIELNKQADFAIIDTKSVDHWLYQFQANACVKTIKSGNVIHE